MKSIRAGLLILVAALSATLTPGAALAKTPRIGFLCARPGPSSHTEAFERGLRELGYAVGKTIAIEYRFMPARGQDAFPAQAAELVRKGVDVIVIGSTLAIEPAKEATRTIPLVMAQSDDPVGARLVASLARPGGNMTGLSSMATELGAKQLDLLRSMLPALSRVAVVWNAASRLAPIQLEALQQSAFRVGVTVLSLPVRIDARELEQAFAAASQGRAGALVVLPDMAFFEHLKPLVVLAGRHRMPAMFGERQFVDAGGLVSYGTNYDELFRRAATYVDRILKGARPGEIPVEQPKTFELVVNRRTAASLGLTIPPALLVRADQVID